MNIPKPAQWLANLVLGTLYWIAIAMCCAFLTGFVFGTFDVYYEYESILMACSAFVSAVIAIASFVKFRKQLFLTTQ